MANYRTFVRGKEKYSLYEKKQLGESLKFYTRTLFEKCRNYN